jgi:hypothetical protein
MWIKASTIAEVEAVARISYIDQSIAARWNEHRREGELRMMTGWVWAARDGSDERAGFKSVTACTIDAWYRLVARAAPPRASRPRLRVVKGALRQDVELPPKRGAA